MSSLSLSNDYKEGKLVKETIERLLQQSTMDGSNKETIAQFIKVAGKFFDGLGFCLSQQKDLLSQWRGYADDGQGFSIGFSKAYLKELSVKKSESNAEFNLYKVVYEPEKHEEELRKVFERIKTDINSGCIEMPHIFFPNQTAANVGLLSKNWKYLISIVSEILPKLYILKNKAFIEENEWRLISYLLNDIEFFKEHTKMITAKHRLAKNSLIPYQEIELEELNNMKRINEVYIGPKNTTPNTEVERFLYLQGFKDVKIFRSSASYR